MADIKFDVNEAYNSYRNQHGNKKNADVKRFIMIIEAILKNETVRNTLYLGVGIIALKAVLDFANERYEIKHEYELEKLLIENNKNSEEELL